MAIDSDLVRAPDGFFNLAVPDRLTSGERLTVMADSAELLPPSLADLREDYRRGELTEASCDQDPIAQFTKWFYEAKAAHLKEPNAMSLATATLQGKPSGRIVLLKEFGQDGFVFYTNYGSRKGQDLRSNPFAALTFFWAELERQVRVEGRMEIVSRERSERYFRGRPKGSRLGALVSRQSAVLPSRAPLEEKLLELEGKYRDSDDVPLPDNWGGYCVAPSYLEFWQGRPNRLHDRITYERKGEGGWVIGRLSP